MLKVIILWIIKFYSIIFMCNYKKHYLQLRKEVWKKIVTSDVKKRGLNLLEFCMQATSFKGKKYNEGR